ncbi:MAG: sigma-70 family RNA polymerase sigma factor [Ruminococcaceae bacterium]|nr:sigma-70 family RNA polymerase sigma factor [Oscillospiraceae bacterium]
MNSFGTDEYITEVVKAYSNSLLKTAFAILKSVDDAEDVVQEVFIKLISKKPIFKSSEHEKAWLLRVTINTSRNLLKSSSRKNLPLEENIPFSYAENMELLSVVMSLPERYRTVIHLHYYEGYSIKEIASIVRKPSATVGTQLARGRKILKEMLKGDYSV